MEEIQGCKEINVGRKILFSKKLNAIYTFKWPALKEGHVRMTTVPVQILSDQKCGRYRCFLSRNHNCNQFFKISFILHQTKLLGVYWGVFRGIKGY